MMELNPDYEYVDYEYITLFIFCRIFITNFQKFLFYTVFMSENRVRNHLGSKWTTEEYIQWNVMIEVMIEVMIKYRLLHNHKF